MSINQTLGRTILTTITTLLVVVTLFLRGGEVLNTFALCLIIGFIAGTYSTIFIASPLVLAWEGKKSKDTGERPENSLKKQKQGKLMGEIRLKNDRRMKY